MSCTFLPTLRNRISAYREWELGTRVLVFPSSLAPPCAWVDCCFSLSRFLIPERELTALLAGMASLEVGGVLNYQVNGSHFSIENALGAEARLPFYA